MRTTLSALALAVAGSSAVSADSQSYLPSIRVRNLGMKAVHKARSTVANDRKLQFDDWGNLTMADIMADIDGSMICGLLDLFQPQQKFDEELAATGIECSQFGCDDNAENLIMECSMMDGMICQNDTDTGDEFCIENCTISMSMGLNLTGTNLITATQSGTYTSPEYMEGDATFTVGISADYGAMMTDAMSGEMDNMYTDTMTEEEIEAAANKALEYFDLTECSGSFADGDILCECNLCDNIMMGVNLTCASDTENYYTQDCTDVSSNAMDIEEVMAGGGPDNVAVFKLMKADDDTGDIATETDTALGGAEETLEEGGDTSAAASKGALATAGLILAVASLV